MSLSRDELLYLMAYVDGQVDQDEIPDVEALLAKNEDARRVVAELGAVGDWVRSSADSRAESGKADTIADAVMAEAERLGGSQVITLERARARRALNRQRVREFGALFAVAAAFALIWAWPGKSHAPTGPATEVAVNVRKGPDYASPMPRPPEKAQGPVVSPGDPTQAATPDKVIPPVSGEALAVGSEEGVDIENVESTHQVSVFYLPVTNKNAASVVVWIGETEESH